MIGRTGVIDPLGAKRRPPLTLRFNPLRLHFIQEATSFASYFIPLTLRLHFIQEATSFASPFIPLTLQLHSLPPSFRSAS